MQDGLHHLLGAVFFAGCSQAVPKNVTWGLFLPNIKFSGIVNTTVVQYNSNNDTIIITVKSRLSRPLCFPLTGNSYYRTNSKIPLFTYNYHPDLAFFMSPAQWSNCAALLSEPEHLGCFNIIPFAFEFEKSKGKFWNAVPCSKTAIPGEFLFWLMYRINAFEAWCCSSHSQTSKMNDRFNSMSNSKHEVIISAVYFFTTWMLRVNSSPAYNWQW